ncbi:MAG: ribonuclease P protein component [bacterium]
MLKKNQRITKKREFDLIFKKGKSAYSPLLGVKSLLNSLTLNRYGLIVSNKVSKRANVRNSIRRKLRTLLFKLDSNIFIKNDIIIIVSPAAKNITSADMEKQLSVLFKKNKLI